MEITLINHACVKIRSKGVGVLCDPWTDGTAFNDGWRLLIETPLNLEEIMEGVTHIWLSHEHPDHFSPKFLSEAAGAYGRIPILFQRTHDRRVASFCQSLGFTVHELPDGEIMALGEGVTAQIGRADFYDSWLLLNDGSARVLNLNDCPLRSRHVLERLKRRIGAPDVLLTQFSYAAWKGGRANRSFRIAAAADKLATIATQINVLQPKSVIPFASFVYFSSVENAYLNDSVNTPESAAETIARAGAAPIVLFPGDQWQVGIAHSNEASLSRFAAVYANLASLPLKSELTSVTAVELLSKFEKYQGRVFSRNSRWLIALLRRLPILGAFRPVRIHLSDLNLTYSISVIDGMVPTLSELSEVEMHSTSLAFILDQDFGFDTLTVNGRFEATPDGFAKLVRAFSIGSLNAMGLSLSLKLVRNLPVIWILIRRLAGVLARLRSTKGPMPSRSENIG